MRPSLLLLLVLVFSGTAFGQSSFADETTRWRQERNDELKAEDGWLTVAGLHWLKQGANSLGTDSGLDIVLPRRSAPGNVGSLNLEGGVVTLKVNAGVTVSVNNSPVSDLVMTFGEKPPPPFRVGSLILSVIKRGERYALRVKDTTSQARREFKGLQWFPALESYRVVATFVPYEEPKEILIENVLGETLKLKTPGTLLFALNGQTYKLRPVIEDEKKLFIIFRDLTAGKTTYGAGRYLYAALPKNGMVVLDFNRSENPPCAFTAYATCPLPPKENRMPIAINAGEKAFHLGKKN